LQGPGMGRPALVSLAVAAIALDTGQALHLRSEDPRLQMARAVTATRVSHSRSWCTEADERIDFEAYRPEWFHLMYRSHFLRNLGADSEPQEVLFSSRHRCCFMEDRILPVPSFIRMFDWYQLGDNESVTAASVKSVFCNAKYLDKCIDRIIALPVLQAGESRVLAVGQDDNPLSETREAVEMLKKSRRFSRILYEAKDFNMTGVKTLPIGLNNWYLQLNGPGNVMKAVQRASLEAKDGGVLAAWGKVWPVLDRRLSSRRGAENFTNNCCFVHREMVSSELYWEALARHRFLMAPSGCGVQTPKVAEALLVLTVPIVDRTAAWEDMAADGWPIVIVDSWEEITRERLVRWHAALAPRLEGFRLRLTAAGAFRDVLRAA